jgi:hypothetical protein
MIEEVIRHRLDVPKLAHPYFDDVDMVGPGEDITFRNVLERDA